MKMNKIKAPALLILSSFLLANCTKLDEKLNSTLTAEQAAEFSSAAGLLKATYDQLQPVMGNEASYWNLTEQTTDELVGPTRGTDWSDNGRWRKLHLHTYDGTHDIMSGVYQNLLIMQYSASNVLNFKPTAQQAAEARFLRAYTMYCTLIGWGQLPFKANDDKSPLPVVLNPADGIAFVIKELNEILPALPAITASGPALANQDAARFLLMKCYLNKGMLINRKAPTFDNADMQQVITLAGQMTGTYSLTDNFFDNFGETNSADSKERIFVLPNGPSIKRTGSNNSAQARINCTLHYAMTPGGWNGFTTLSDFYDKFEATDTRRGGDYPKVTSKTGIKAGLLLGQQYDQTGAEIIDQRAGAPLIFTREVNLVETEKRPITQSGIRVYKITASSQGQADNPTNDIMFFRYADVLLMKAEAQFRSGDAASALAGINVIRTKRGASSLSALTADVILDERARELYWEGWRREDQLRFGTLLKPNQLKPGTSADAFLLFPIPVNDLAANPNLKQNPGFE
jgi:starch-binding outer membrane protein, SusD/RagB family